MSILQPTPFQQKVLNIASTGKVYLHGNAGCGKTTAAILRLHALIEQGIPADNILILVPQRSQTQPFMESIQHPNRMAGGDPALVTIGGLAQRMVSLFWPLVARQAGFAHPEEEPHFLTLETAQYFMSQLVEPLLQKGYFESLTIDPNRLFSQILDNLNKSAVVGFSPQQIATRLIDAWAGKPAQGNIYQQAQECALSFRDYCLQHNLLDFSLQLSLFTDSIWPSLLCRKYLTSTYRHLIYDNVEEDYPVAHDIILDWLPEFESSLVICDEQGGFRTFMGADPVSAARFNQTGTEVIEAEESLVESPALKLLDQSLWTSLTTHRLQEKLPNLIESAFSINSFRFYPQAMDWVSATIKSLVTDQQTPANEIVVLSPFLSDSLRYSLQSRFTEVGLNLHTLRPSRGLKEEPVINAMLTLAKLAHPAWGMKPSRDEVRNATLLLLDDCDYIRADLLTQVLYSHNNGLLRPFAPVNKLMQERITYRIGERFENLRTWIESYRQGDVAELDVFFGRAFGELVSQPGYKFHHQSEAAAVISRLVESARKFRQVMSGLVTNPGDLNAEFIHLVESGVISAQYISEWRMQNSQDSILVAPAFSFLMSNRPVKYQFWLDIGSQGWWTRLDQPLTHPHVLSRNWDAHKVWSDAQENAVNQLSLARVACGLVKRCKEHIFMVNLGLNEQGNEERGALLMGLQNLLRKMRIPEVKTHV